MTSKTKSTPFWQSLSLEDLAAAQGVTSVEDLDEVAALWPTNDDPDALFDFVLKQRAQRREAAHLDE